MPRSQPEIYRRNDVSYLRLGLSVISCVLNAHSGRYADALISYCTSGKVGPGTLQEVVLVSGTSVRGGNVLRSCLAVAAAAAAAAAVAAESADRRQMSSAAETVRTVQRGPAAYNKFRERSNGGFEIDRCTQLDTGWPQIDQWVTGSAASARLTSQPRYFSGSSRCRPEQVCTLKIAYIESAEQNRTAELNKISKLTVKLQIISTEHDCRM